MKERERAIERVKERIKPIFFKDSILAFLQTDVACHLVVKQAHRSYNTEVLLTCFLLFMVLLQGKSISYKHGNDFFPVRCFFFFFINIMYFSLA